MGDWLDLGFAGIGDVFWSQIKSSSEQVWECIWCNNALHQKIQLLTTLIFWWRFLVGHDPVSGGCCQPSCWHKPKSDSSLSVVKGASLLVMLLLDAPWWIRESTDWQIHRLAGFVLTDWNIGRFYIGGLQIGGFEEGFVIALGVNLEWWLSCRGNRPPWSLVMKMGS